ncbi:MAG: aldo/keto reductase [Acidobacteria bacterium]|nr:aldo/keto reductase [Acidobacteriota bacterium]
MVPTSPLPRRSLRTRTTRLPLTVLGFGGAPLGNLYAPVAEEDARATLEAAWAEGLRLFDTAPLYGYGLSEERFSRLLAVKPRDEFVLSTKVGRLLRECAPGEVPRGQFHDTPQRTFDYDYSYDGVMRSYEDSLRRLRLDRIDILFVHDVDVFTHGSRAAADARIDELFSRGGYRALEALRASGAIAAFGAGVNEWEICEALAHRGDFDVFLLAGRYTLLEQDALASFLPLCEARDIGVIVGGPFNSGILATGAVQGAHYNYSPAPPDVLARVERIERVCRAHGVGLKEAALQFVLGHPVVKSVIPGANAAAQVRANAALLRAPIPDALWADLEAQGLVRAGAPVPGSGGALRR